MNYVLFFIQAIFPYIALAVFIIISLYRFLCWIKRPVPLRIHLAPAKTTRKGVIKTIICEITVFISLFKTDRKFWLAAWVMHVCGLIILLGSHTYGVIAETGSYYNWYSLPLGRTIPLIAAFFSFPLLISLLYLLLNRIFRGEVRRISLLGDYLALGLILVTILAGMYMAYVTGFNLDEGIKWGIGLVTFHPYLVEDNWAFTIHILVAFGLFLYFPFSKLFHPLGQLTNQMTMVRKEDSLIKNGSVVK